MKKPVKITLISLTSLLAVTIMAVGIAIAVILSPKQLSKIVNKVAKDYILCDYHIGNTGLTIFKTFPQLSVNIEDVVLINPVVGAPTDTLLSVKHCLATLDIKELLKNQQIVVSKFLLQNGDLHLFNSLSGKQNYDVLNLQGGDDTDNSYAFDLDNISLENVNADYLNLSSQMRAAVRDLNATVKGQYQGNDAEGVLAFKTAALTYQTIDSSAFTAQTDNLTINFDGKVADMDDVKGALKVQAKGLYVQKDTNNFIDHEDVRINTEFDGSLSLQKILIESMELLYDQYRMELSGDIQRDTANGDIQMDLSYNTGAWPIAEFLQELPNTIAQALPDSMQLDGLVTLGGTVKGTYGDNSMPLITSNVSLKDANFGMGGMPFDIQHINGEADLNLDLDHQTDLKIRSVEGNVRDNHVVVNGTVRDLLGKMLCNLSLNGTIRLEDFQDLLPESIIPCKGIAKSSVKAEFDYEQIKKMQIDKMTASGDFHVTNFDLLYEDSLRVKSKEMDLTVNFPVKEKPYKIDEWIKVGVQSPHLYCESIDFFKANLTDGAIDVFLNNLFDDSEPMKLGTSFVGKEVTFETDSIDAKIDNPKGTFSIKETDHLALQLQKCALDAKVGDLKVTTPDRKSVV